MNLGYLMVPHVGDMGEPAHDLGRIDLARDLGFSEFYAVGRQCFPTPSQGSIETPEHAEYLRILSGFPDKPIPQIATINGKRQPPNDTSRSARITRPSVTPQQVRSHARAQQASLSVSWLDKTELARHWAAHVAGSTHANLPARTEDWRIARTILVCDDASRAEAAVKSDDGPCRAYYSKIAGPNATRRDVDALIEACVLYGDLQSVLNDLHDIAATSGPFGTLILVDHKWPDAELAQQSMTSLASAIEPVARRTRASN